MKNENRLMIEKEDYIDPDNIANDNDENNNIEKKNLGLSCS
jgi:hypothetical protein